MAAVIGSAARIPRTFSVAAARSAGDSASLDCLVSARHLLDQVEQFLAVMADQGLAEQGADPTNIRAKVGGVGQRIVGTDGGAMVSVTVPSSLSLRYRGMTALKHCSRHCGADSRHCGADRRSRCGKVSG